MPSLTAKDRISLCLFTYEDGRRCRTPRSGNHPHFCFYHAQKESRAQAAETLSEDLAYLFSGDYLSACDLSSALSHLIPAVIRGDIEPRLARTVAYMCQTLAQSIHISQREYANAFGTEGWRKTLRHSVNANHDYLFPPDPDDDASDEAKPEPQQPQPPQPQRTQPQPQQPNASSSQIPSRPQQSAPARPQPPSADGPSPANVEAALSVARELFPARPSSTPAQFAAPATNHATLMPQPSASTNQPNTQTSQPENAMPPGPPRPQAYISKALNRNVSPLSATLTKSQREGISDNCQSLPVAQVTSRRAPLRPIPTLASPRRALPVALRRFCDSRASGLHDSSAAQQTVAGPDRSKS